MRKRDCERPGGAVFRAGGQYRVGTSKAASLKGLAFTGGTLGDASGAARPDIGCYECADKAGAVLYLK